jgi:hypothetical protein
MIAAHIQLVLIVTGAATALALGQFVAPSRLLRLVYGKAPTDAAGLMLARQWGLLVCGVGILLIYAAFYPPLRVPVMIFAVVEKVALGASILGTALRQQGPAAAIAVGDLLIALVYVLYLVGL